MTDLQELRKAAQAVFLATDEKVAQDLSDKLNGAAAEIERLTGAITNLQVIDLDRRIKRRQ